MRRRRCILPTEPAEPIDVGRVSGGLPPSGVLPILAYPDQAALTAAVARDVEHRLGLPSGWTHEWLPSGQHPLLAAADRVREAVERSDRPRATCAGPLCPDCGARLVPHDFGDGSPDWACPYDPDSPAFGSEGLAG